METNRFAKWAGSYRPSFENAGLTGLKGLMPTKPQAFRGFKPRQSSNPTAEERGLTGLKSTSVPAQPRPFVKPEAPPDEGLASNSKPAEASSNPSNPQPGAMGLTPDGSGIEEIRGFQAVQTHQTRQTPNLNNAEQKTGPRADTVPAGDDAAAWTAWFDGEVADRARLGAAAARRRVYGLAVLRWHAKHGAQVDPARCAGCGALLDQNKGMDLGDGTRVHLGGTHGLDCLTMQFLSRN